MSPGLSVAYDDDLKFEVKADDHGFALGQTAITFMKEWSDSILMLLSIKKSMVLHCGTRNVKHQFMLGDYPMPTANVIKDLGVLRSELKPYSDHVTLLSADCRRLSGAIRWAFRSRDAELLRTAYQAFVQPKIMYGAFAWSPILNMTKRSWKASSDDSQKFCQTTRHFHMNNVCAR